MNEDFAPNADELIGLNERFATQTHDGDVAKRPVRKLAVVCCMDARINTQEMLGLANGEAHIIRNAGGVITDDVIRSLCLSQRSLGTREVLLVHHTDCGLQGVDEASFRRELEDEVGVAPSWPLEAFDDPYVDVRHSIQRLLETPFLAHKDNIRGFVYDVADGRLHEVDPSG